METHLADWLQGTPDGEAAQDILRKCVHCGFCTATCPTYQLLGDELDGPRGRIYLIKQVVEGATPTLSTQQHLDRCLTCRNCESTCPSGVQYGHLVDIGRKLVDQKVERPLGQRLLRGALREGLTRRWLFDPAMRVGKMVRPMLPETLKKKVPEAASAGVWPKRQHRRQVLMLNGCVQPAMMPNIDSATARVLDRLGVTALVLPQSGCCGAIRQHLDDHTGALADIKRNIDAWWPMVQAGSVEAIVINTTGCGAMLKDYAYLLRNDAAYSAKAERISAITQDVSVYLAAQVEQIETQVNRSHTLHAAFHPPCTLQHGQQIKGETERLLTRLGVKLAPVADSHLCCGSAGTYSVLQPELSTQLRDRKLGNLQAAAPAQILSANIGCLTHLQSGTTTPVRHWIEWLDEVMAASSQ
jgi:glycolate oxidase iron-sulfur subunit